MKRSGSGSRCTACNVEVGMSGGVHLGGEQGTRFLCESCYNAVIAEYLGLDFEHVDFAPVTLQDARGQSHTFEFRTRIFGEQLRLTAIENIENGYEFSIIADVEQDLFVSFQRLFERLRRELSRQHLQPCDDHYQIRDYALRGMITSGIGDANELRFIIDGKSFSLEELGALVSPFMGFRFKLELLNLDEEK
jgi:hypothetical protein